MENRRFSRVSFKGKAKLQINQQMLDCDILDLSLKGALVKTTDILSEEPTSPMTLHISLNDFELELTMLVSLSHQHDKLLGLYCEKIDIESVSHLRRLLELNLGDSELLTRELSELSAH